MRTTPALLDHLAALQVTVSLTPAGKLGYEGPEAALTPALLEELAAHKPALLTMLQAPPSASEMLEHMYSAVLGCEFWVVQTDAEAQRQRHLGRAAYSTREVKLLQAMKRRDPEGYDDKLRAIHLCHDLFAATLLQVERSSA
jgi:hypothetical protein